MRFSAALRWTSVMALVLGTVGTATADGGGIAPSNPSSGGTGTVPFQATQNMTPQEIMTKAQSLISGMEQGSATIGRQLEQARAARNVVKTLFLNDKKSQIDVVTRMAKERYAKLQALLAPYLGQGALEVPSDGSKAKLPPTLLAQAGGGTVPPEVMSQAMSLLESIQYAANQANQILAEAQSVVGSEVGFTGAATVSVSINPDIPNDTNGLTTYNPTTGITNTTTITPPPPPVSPNG